MEDGPARPAARSRVDEVREAEALDHMRHGRRDAATRVLMTTYGDHVRAYARGVVRDDELAKDICQQVFIEAWQKLEQFEGRASLWSWLCGIAYHRCLDAMRRRGRTSAREVSIEVDVLDAVSGTSGSSMTSDLLHQRQALERCLAKLPDAMRAQLLMRCYDGLSYAEIGAIAGDTPGTVQVRIARILPRLRRCLETQENSR